MSDSEAALAALAMAAEIWLRSCASSIWASWPSPSACSSPPLASPGESEAALDPSASCSSVLPSSGGDCGSGWSKNRSKQSPSAFFSSCVLASVSRNVSRRMVRSAKPTLETARIASMLSAGESLTPAPRAARKKRCRFSLIPCLSEYVLTRGLGDEGRDLGHGGLDVGLILQEDVERILDHLVAKLGSLQQHQHRRPFDRPGYLRQFFHVGG